MTLIKVKLRADKQFKKTYKKSLKVSQTNKQTNKQKNPGWDNFSAESYQAFQKGLMPVLLKLFHKRETEGTLPNSFYETTATLKSRPQRDSITTTTKELQINFPCEHQCKNNR